MTAARSQRISPFSLNGGAFFQTDSLVLVFGNFCLATILVLVKVVFQPRGSLGTGLLYVFAFAGMVLFTISSFVFLFMRWRRYGALLALIPLSINILTYGTIFAFGEQRFHISDPDLILYDRLYSPDGQFVNFAFALGDAESGMPTYECVMPTADTSNNLGRYRIPHGLFGVGWNPDNSLNVRAAPWAQSTNGSFSPGDTLIVRGIILRITGPAQ